MDFNLLLQFGKSPSPNYEKALKIARSFGSFKPITAERFFNQIELDFDNFKNNHKNILHLWELISGWKTTSTFINGQEINFHSFRFHYEGIVRCQDARQRSTMPERHCWNSEKDKGWGCKRLACIARHNMKPYSYSERNKPFWFEFGHFLTKNEWKIDKDKLRKALKNEAQEKHLYFCNIFDFNMVDRSIKALPDVIKLNDSPNWTIRHEVDDYGNEIEKIPVGIMPKKWEKVDNNQGGENNKPNTVRHIPSVSFSDIGGIDEILQAIREVIQLPLIYPDLFQHLGIKPHKGILLHGPPGCGKTLIARAIANEINAHFIPVGGPEIMSKWYGESEENIRNIFKEARLLRPSIIFFDEIDSIAQARSSAESERQESRIVNQLLTLMDGIEEYENICIIASTNRIELIDEAMRRPGRFDYVIEVKKPNPEGCHKIFKIATKKMPIDPAFNARSFTGKLYGLTGADIAFVAREGAYNCIRRGMDIPKALKVATSNERLSFGQLIVKKVDFELALDKLLEQVRDQKKIIVRKRLS